MKQARGAITALVLVLLSCLSCLAVAPESSNPIDDFERLVVTDMCAMLPEDTSFLRPSTCNHWVRCASAVNVIEEGACASGLYYNKELGRCTQAENVICPYVETDHSSNPCATEADGTFLADPTNCRGYILCKSRAEIYSNCPNDLVFHPQTRSCVYANQYKCPESSIGNTVTPVCRSLPNNTHIADDKLCAKYYVCINDVLFERECGSQMAYDAARGRCVSVNEVKCFGTAEMPKPENTFCVDNSTGRARTGYFADDESCSHYYICGSPINGKHDTEPQHLQCQIGQFFDYEKLSCRDRLNVKCTLDRCIGSTLTYVNVAGDCQNYARCVNGATADTGRCPTNYYFDERSQGCTPTNHHYIACTA